MNRYEYFDIESPSPASSRTRNYELCMTTERLEVFPAVFSAQAERRDITEAQPSHHVREQGEVIIAFSAQLTQSSKLIR